MAELFESWLYPLVIILSVPLGVVGGILGLRLLGVYLGLQGQPPQTLDVLTMLGFIILVGTRSQQRHPHRPSVAQPPSF